MTAGPTTRIEVATHLDVAGRQAPGFVASAGRATTSPSTSTTDSTARLFSDRHCFRRSRAGIERDLDDSRPVSQVDEDEATEIARCGEPNRQGGQVARRAPARKMPHWCVRKPVDKASCQIHSPRKFLTPCWLLIACCWNWYWLLASDAGAGTSPRRFEPKAKSSPVSSPEQETDCVVESVGRQLADLHDAQHPAPDVGRPVRDPSSRSLEALRPFTQRQRRGPRRVQGVRGKACWVD